MKHQLKTWPEFFPAIVAGFKTFEIRKNDRDFKIGDELELLEFAPCKTCQGTGAVRVLGNIEDCKCNPDRGTLTGRKITKYISYFTGFGQIEGNVVLGLSSIPFTVASPEILYFGCYNGVGHDLRSKRNPQIRYHETPWGNSLDGGVKPHYAPMAISYEKKGGWSLIDFVDNSVDTRGGSHSAFIARIELTPEEILLHARAQWPEVFSRPRFPQIRRVVDP